MVRVPRLHSPRRMLNELRLSKRLDHLALEIHSDLGFFAQLNWCLYVLAYCEQRGLSPRICLTGSSYAEAPSRDWFHDFFEERKSEGPNAGGRLYSKALKIRHIQETSFAARYAASMTIEWAHRLFHAYWRVHPAIASYVDGFVESQFAGDEVIGLHFRGTDKKMEAKPVEWSRCFLSAAKFAADHPSAKKVFVSSDDGGFIDWFTREARGTFSVIVHPDQERSRDAQPVHTNSAGSGHRKGFEALVNCLLLSRCAALIRTASFLSGWSSVFNPLLPITLLNEPYAHVRWFPDRELITRSDNRYR
jgi:nodulation protein Z